MKRRVRYYENQERKTFQKGRETNNIECNRDWGEVRKVIKLNNYDVWVEL